MAIAALLAFIATRSPFPSDGSVDAGFARDMSAHHSQAVEMAMIAQLRTDDPQIRLLAQDIALTQQAQIGQMSGWLQVWGLATTGSEAPMTWMGQPTEGLMPGMATSEQVDALNTLPVAEMNVSFLRLMIVHHQAGVAMAQAALDRGVGDEGHLLANAIIAGQQAEIEQMNAMLTRLGSSPVAPGAGADAMPGMTMSPSGEVATPTP